MTVKTGVSNFYECDFASHLLFYQAIDKIGSSRKGVSWACPEFLPSLRFHL